MSIVMSCTTTLGEGEGRKIKPYTMWDEERDETHAHTDIRHTTVAASKCRKNYTQRSADNNSLSLSLLQDSLLCRAVRDPFLATSLICADLGGMGIYAACSPP